MFAQFRKIISCEDVEYLVPCNHRIFEKGIFRELNPEQKTIFPSEYLNYIIYKWDIPFEKAPELLRLILPYFMKSLQEKCNKILMNYIISMDPMFKFSCINIIDIIESFDEPIVFSEFLCKVESFKNKSYIMNKKELSPKMYSQDLSNNGIEKFLNYVDFDIVIMKEYPTILKDDNILEHILNNINLKSPSEDNIHLIHYLCEHSSPKMIKMAIDLGAELECEDSDKRRAIHYACEHSNSEIIIYLVNKGVKLDVMDSHHCTILHYLCFYQKIKALRYIIKYDAILKYLEDYNTGNCTALSLSYFRPNIKIIRIMIEGGANMYPKIWLLFRKPTLEIIQYMISRGMNPEYQVWEKKKVIHFMCEHGTLEIIKYMVSLNIDLECTDNFGKKPIHYVCQYGTEESMKYMLNLGVDMEAKQGSQKVNQF